MDENKEYPSNSHSSKLRPSVPITSPPSAALKPEQEQSEERPKVEKAIEGTATVKRKTVGSRFKTIFTGVSLKDVVDDVVDQAIIPGIKGLLFDAGERALERWLGNGTGHGRNMAKGIVTNVAHVAYNKFSSPSPTINHRSTVMQPQQQMSRRAQAVFDFDEIEFQTRQDATIVLNLMYDQLENYGTVSVAEFYGWADVKGNFTDRNYGWRSLEGAGPTKIRNGMYILNLPNPVPLT
jgi:hypothetical protein